MIQRSIELELWDENKFVLYMHQGEINARELEVTFKHNNEIFSLENKQVIFYARKPDGNFVYNNCELSTQKTGTVLLTVTSQVVSECGEVRCEFHIIDNEQNMLKVKGLKIIVLYSANVDEAIESTSEFTFITETLNKVSNLDSQINELQGKVSTAETDITELENKVSTAETDISTLEGSLSTAETNISTIESQITGAQTSVGTLQSDITEAETDIDGLQTDVTNLQSTINDMQSQISGIVSEESGNWTPEIAALDGSTMECSYFYRYGRYVRIGTLVYITFRIRVTINNAGGDNNFAMIQGLPFNAFNSNTTPVDHALSMYEMYGDFQEMPGKVSVIRNTNYLLLLDAEGHGKVKWNTGDFWIACSGFYIK